MKQKNLPNMNLLGEIKMICKGCFRDLNGYILIGRYGIDTCDHFYCLECASKYRIKGEIIKASQK